MIEVSRNGAAALNALGYTLADQTDRYEEAYELLKRAIAIMPDDPAIIDSMGWVHYRLGNYDARSTPSQVSQAPAAWSAQATRRPRY